MRQITNQRRVGGGGGGIMKPVSGELNIRIQKVKCYRYFIGLKKIKFKENVNKYCSSTYIGYLQTRTGRFRIFNFLL